MDDKLRQIEGLLAMFDARDAMWAKHNRQIAGVITATVLDALQELFELPDESIEWVDLQIMENILLVVCNVTYDPATTQSPFLQRVDEVQQPDRPIQVQRYLRVGVPLAIVFSPKEDIKEFLMRIPVETAGDDAGTAEVYEPDLDPSEVESDETLVYIPPKSSTKVMGFDTSTLSEEQIKNLMLYNHTVESTKQ